MPLIDFNETDPTGGIMRPEFLIIGAGAVGIFLAVRLARLGRRVLLLESGHFLQDDDRQALNQIEESAKQQGNSIWNRKRVLGGTTTAWGGQSLPFSPLDFEPREWVGPVRWPIRYADLEPHYAQANAFMRIDSWNYRSDLETRLRLPNPGFDQKLVDFHFSKWAPQPNFFKLQRRVLEQDVTVLYNAHLVRIHQNDDRRVRAVEVVSFNGRRTMIEADTFLLATGGIEACRTLLLAERQAPGMMGNHSGWLGRAYMDHPCLRVGTIETPDERRLQRIFSTQWHRRWKYSVRLHASDSWQREHGMLNTCGGLMFTSAPPEEDWFAAIKEMVCRPTAQNATELWRLRHDACVGLKAFLGDQFVYRPRATASFGLMTEQEPSNDSYVALSEDRDRFGLPKARLHWRITEKTWRTKRAFAVVMKAEIERLGLGRVTLIEPIVSGTKDWEDLLSDVNHHMGGTRLSARPEEGVVDEHLRVWNVANLHVCSASVFPTSSHSNPTLTVLALCSRLIGHLMSTVKR